MFYFLSVVLSEVRFIAADIMANNTFNLDLLMDKIIASTQEDEWKGTAAFDDSDHHYLREFAILRGYIGDDDSILGFKATLEIDKCCVCIFYAKESFFDLSEHGDKPNKKEFYISINKFFDLFKSVTFAATHKNIGDGLA